VTSALGGLPGVAVRSTDGFPNIDLNTCRVSLTSRRVAHVRRWATHGESSVWTRLTQFVTEICRIGAAENETGWT